MTTKSSDSLFVEYREDDHILLFVRIVLRSFIQSIMWAEVDSDDECQQTSGPMRGQVTEKHPNEAKKKKCNCKKGCLKRSCACFKFGSGCNATCGCGPSCQNMFNHLEYFFGSKEKVSAHPCFANWLVAKAKNPAELQLIDRDQLREDLLQCGR